MFLFCLFHRFNALILLKQKGKFCPLNFFIFVPKDFRYAFCVAGVPLDAPAFIRITPECTECIKYEKQEDKTMCTDTATIKYRQKINNMVG